MAYCGERCISTIDQHVYHAVTLKCRSWSCQECAPDRTRQLIAKAIRGQPSKFITITSRRRDGMTPEQAARELVRAWRLIRRLWHRQHPNDRIEFLAVFEATKLGWPHLHILANCRYISQRWISKQMDRLTGSPVCWIESVRARKKVASYVSKYTAKGPGQFGTLKRYWTSQRYEKNRWIKPKSPTEWMTERMSLTRWVDMMRDVGGFTIVMINANHATAHRPAKQDSKRVDRPPWASSPRPTHGRSGSFAQ